MDINKLIEAAKAGGEILMKYFGQSLETIEKSTASDFRTQADLESEKIILKIINSEFPEWNIISEEQGKTDKGSEYTIVIDPLDGTNNFSLGIPNFTISIGVLKGEEIIAGVVYAPVMNLVYQAEKGKGSFLNGVKLKTNTENSLQKISVAIICGYTNSYELIPALIKKFNEQKTKRILTNWSPAFDFCLLASGKIEAIIHNNFEIYDYAAGKLIASEAGALITDFEENPINDKAGKFIASNGSSLHQQLINVVKNI